MMLYTIGIFFIIMFGLGIGYSMLVKKRRVTLLEFLMIGIMAFPITAVAVNLIGIHMNYIYFAMFGSACLGFYVMYFDIDVIGNFKWCKDIHLWVAVFLALIVFGVMLKGSFSYPWLEDDDPYDHAVAASYIAEYETLSRDIEPETFKRTYLEPYPPGYPAMMGLLYQSNDSVSWTLKFFNSLLCGIAIIFFYMFAGRLFGDETKALIATFIIAMLPSFMTHFIWSQTLAIVVMLATLYFLLQVRKSLPNSIIAGIGIASLLVTQPSTAFIFAILFGIMILIKAIFEVKKEGHFVTSLYWIIIGVMGFITSLFVYWIPTYMKFGWDITMQGIGVSTGLFSAGNVDTSGGVIYKITEFIIPPLSTKIDQATGWGLGVFIFMVIGLLLYLSNFKKLKALNWLIISWFVICMLGVYGNALPIKLFPHRFWVFLAIPVALLCAETIYAIIEMIPNKIYRWMFIIGVIILVVFTSFVPKMTVQTSPWPPGLGFTTQEELSGYISLKNDFGGTPYKIFNLCHDEEKIIGFDMLSDPLHGPMTEFRNNLADFNNTEIFEEVDWYMENYQYSYFVFDVTCARYLGNRTGEVLDIFGANYGLVQQIPNHFYLFERGLI